MGVYLIVIQLWILTIFSSYMLSMIIAQNERSVCSRYTTFILLTLTTLTTQVSSKINITKCCSYNLYINIHGFHVLLLGWGLHFCPLALEYYFVSNYYSYTSTAAMHLGQAYHL